MLKPDKFTQLDRSLVYTVALMIEIFLNYNNRCSYEFLYKSIEERIGDDVLYLFIPAIDFLFLLGKIKYDIETDNLELVI